MRLESRNYQSDRLKIWERDTSAVRFARVILLQEGSYRINNGPKAQLG